MPCRRVIRLSKLLMITALTPLQSLRTKVVLTVLGAFAIAISATSWHWSHTLHKDMQAQISAQEFSTVSLVAQQLDYEFVDRFDDLHQAAAMLHHHFDGKRNTLQSALTAMPLLLKQFSGGVIAYGSDGKVMAGTPNAAGRIGVYDAGSDMAI